MKDFLKRHLNVRSEIVGVNRKDIYEIPFEALREAIANAIIHRDYNVRGTSITIEVYDDRVEITNPGGLPKGLAIKDFGKISIRRNEHIADLFFRMDKVELAGTGIRRMKDAMAQEDLPSPKIKQANFFTITFKRLSLADLDRIFASRMAPPSTPRVGVEKLGEKLGENEKRIIGVIKKNRFVTIKELSEILKISTTAIENNLARLKQKGMMQRVGSAKAGHWEIIDKW